MRFCPNGPQMPMILYGNIEWLLNVIMSVIIYIIGWIWSLDTNKKVNDMILEFARIPGIYKYFLIN